MEIVAAVDHEEEEEEQKQRQKDQDMAGGDNVRPIRLLIITMGGPRRAALEELIRLHNNAAAASAADGVGGSSSSRIIEPTFVPGVPSRALRSRQSFARYVHAAGLLPPIEWDAVKDQVLLKKDDDDRCDDVAWEEALAHLPKPTTAAVRSTARRTIIDEDDGDNDDDADTTTHPSPPSPTQNSTHPSYHYLLEMWYKSKSLSRDRAVLACTLAHLIAMRQFVGGGGPQGDGTCTCTTNEAENENGTTTTSGGNHDDDNDNDDYQYDAILEDNVRWHKTNFGPTMRAIRTAQTRYEKQHHTKVQMQYYGWLASVPNLRWTYHCHIPREHHDTIDDNNTTLFGFPDPQQIAHDVASGAYHAQVPPPTTTTTGEDGRTSNNDRDDRDPGGNPVWGAYGYWISKEAYQTVLDRLRADVGALLWKGKRQRQYRAKPIDKILPRIIRRTYGPHSVLLCQQPAVFRAPMLASTIHAQYDAEFCKSTSLQLRLMATNNQNNNEKEEEDDADDGWSSLALTESERAVVAYWRTTGEWITPVQLRQPQQQEQPP